jgi:UDP-3-O-[3-hydroxymyristoyl] N-acetylglucosamine deacetylase
MSSSMVPMFLQQRTIAQTVACTGIGMHSGKEVHLRIHPAPINHGIKFVRTDLPECPSISAHFNMVVDTSLATVIGYDGFIVSTIEHLMACFAGLSVDNALVELDAYEVPIMDGSAGPFAKLILEAGIKEQIGARYYFVINEPIELTENGKSVSVHPSPSFRITCTIEYEHPLIRKQSCSVYVSDQVFESEISRARTYGFIHEIDYLKRYGFARGGSLDNAVVVDTHDILNNEGLRYPDEFVRHKILDCIGDFSLLGMPILGHVVLHKSGHTFNHAFLRKFFEQREAWETRTIGSIDQTGFLSKSLAI